MTRKIGRIPPLPPDSGLNVAILAMAASMSGNRESAEMLAECAETLLETGAGADALDWFSFILEGGEPELAPHAALRMGDALVDDDMEAAQAAWRYAADHGAEKVAEAAKENQKILARHDIPARTTPATAEEVVGRAALARGRMWVGEGDLDAAIKAFGQAAESPLPDVAAEAYAYLGSALSMAGAPDEAVPMLERAIATGHRRYGPMAAVDLSSILTARGQADRAVAVLRHAQHGEGWAAAMAAVTIGVLLARELGDLHGGLAELRRVAAGPDPMAAAGGLFNLATLLEEYGDAAGARQAYQDAVTLEQPMFSGKAAVNLGILLTREQDFQGAGAAWTRALHVGGPEDAAKAQEMLARLDGVGELSEAGVDLNDPEAAGAGAIRAAEHFLEQGELQQALRCYERAMDTGHPVQAPWGAAFVAYLFSREHGEQGAETAIGRLGEIGSGALEPRAWFLFGVLMTRGADLIAADAAWRRVPRTARDAFPAAASLLWVLHRDPEQAEASFGWVLEVAADLAGEVVLAVLDLGRARLGRGDEGAAHQAFGTARRMAAGSGDADLAAYVEESLAG
ncbi:tetratricopeptide repeat protein [Nonomuraea typhae]|uniref:tetratricopeptide repeat protein n=1 Tax=Nonomuraea typhae TaxID=2603600 RepID=UPI0012FBC5D2|nr:tetratricopeptide repeat protein [Nonomuraea typhae]